MELLPLYYQFGGSICVCLRRWLSAPVMTDSKDTSYWLPPARSSTGACKVITSPEFQIYIDERLQGNLGACLGEHWIFGDPRFSDADNPLYDPLADRLTDWIKDVKPSDYAMFVKYVDTFYNPANQKNGEKDVTAMRVKKIMQEKLYESADKILSGEDDEWVDDDSPCSCNVSDSECEDVVWCSEREYLPDVPHCDCNYISNIDSIENPTSGRLRTDTENNSVVYYTSCMDHDKYVSYYQRGSQSLMKLNCHL